jgi:hypothetical protein
VSSMFNTGKVSLVLVIKVTKVIDIIFNFKMGSHSHDQQV